jgi:hypothetical protein
MTASIGTSMRSTPATFQRSICIASFESSVSTSDHIGLSSSRFIKNPLPRILS